MYTVIKHTPKKSNIILYNNKIIFSNYYQHYTDTLQSLYSNEKINKILEFPQDTVSFQNDIVKSIFTPAQYPIELHTKISILNSMFPYPKYSRNTFLECMKNQKLLPNSLSIDMNIDKKVNINFIAEAYLLSNIEIDSPKIEQRIYYNERDKMPTDLSIKHCRQEHCDGQLLFNYQDKFIKKMVDVKLYRPQLNEGSRIYPIILDLENKMFTGIKNEQYLFKNYQSEKNRLVEKLIQQYPNNSVILDQLKILNHLINEDLDLQTKLKLIQEQQHKIFCLINTLNLENRKPRFNPEILHIQTGTYKDQPLPEILQPNKKKQISFGTIFQNEYPELYKNIRLCHNTIWGWDITYLDNIEVDIFI